MTSTNEWKAFERAWAEMIVESVNRLRAAADLTVKELASRLTTAGWPVSNATLSGILSGHKRGSISVTEWLAFAAALDVPPLYLVAGLPASERAPDSPMWSEGGQSIDSVAAWITGDTENASSNTPKQLARPFSGSAVRNLVSHAVMMDRVQWQAAQVLALAEMPERLRAGDIFNSVASQEQLRSSLAWLAGARSEERMVDPEWRLRLPQLPQVLAPLDELAPADTVPDKFTFPILTIRELRSIASASDVAKAKDFIRGSIERTRKLQRIDDGTPSHPTE